jgi:hypothetical protein
MYMGSISQEVIMNTTKAMYIEINNLIVSMNTTATEDARWVIRYRIITILDAISGYEAHVKNPSGRFDKECMYDR